MEKMEEEIEMKDIGMEEIEMEEEIDERRSR